MAVRRFAPAVLRLIPVAWAIAAHVPTAAVYRLRFSVRGWNGDGRAVLGDARWAIDQIAAAHPGLPIVVVGHSLGGRVAMHVVGSSSRSSLVVPGRGWLARWDWLPGWIRATRSTCCAAFR